MKGTDHEKGSDHAKDADLERGADRQHAVDLRQKTVGQLDAGHMTDKETCDAAGHQVIAAR